MTVVTMSLFRAYRPIFLWFLGMIVVVAAVVTAVDVAVGGGVQESWWLVVFGQAVRWWLLVAGILLVATHLRVYVTNGVTRHAFLRGAGLFGVLAALGFAVVLVLGRGAERLLWAAGGSVPADHPAFTAGRLLTEVGTVLPAALAGLVTGALTAAVFYRFPPRTGLLLLVPALLPVVAAEALLGLYTDVTPEARPLPLAAGVAVSLALTLGGTWLIFRFLGDVAIRRAAG
jgi:hypothetical protein